MEPVRDYKIVALGAVAAITAAVGRVLPAITEADGVDLMGATTSIAAGIWQIANPPSMLITLYAEDARLGHGQVEFEPAVRRMTAVVLTGLLHR